MYAIRGIHRGTAIQYNPIYADITENFFNWRNMNPSSFRSLVAATSLCVVLGVVILLDRGTVRKNLPRHQPSNDYLRFTGTDTNVESERVTDTPTDNDTTIDEVQSNAKTRVYSRPKTTITTTATTTTTTTLAQDSDSGYKLTTSNAFLGFVDINEQLSSNTIMFLQLSYFSAVWNLTMIEPWIDTRSAHLYSLPPVKKTQTLLFFDLYNKTAVEMQLTKCFNSNLPKQRQLHNKFVFHSLKNAIIHSPRDVLIVIFKTKQWTKTIKNGNGECGSISGKPKKNVISILNNQVQKFKNEAQKVHGRDFMFRVWKTVCITAITGRPFSMNEATIFIQKQLASKQRETNKSATVVFPSWKKVKSVNPYGYYYDPNFRFNKRYCQDSGLPHSSKVMTAADRMLGRKGFSGHFISVYARTERMSPDAVKKCLKRFPKLLNSKEKLYGIPRSRVILIHDAGKYGSKSFNKRSRRKSHKILVFLKRLKMTIVHYDPNQNKDLPQDRTFVAAVEQEFISRSHVLVTLGRGGFMTNVKDRFVARQSVDRAYSLCN